MLQTQTNAMPRTEATHLHILGKQYLRKIKLLNYRGKVFNAYNQNALIQYWMQTANGIRKNSCGYQKFRMLKC